MAAGNGKVLAFFFASWFSLYTSLSDTRSIPPGSMRRGPNSLHIISADFCKNILPILCVFGATPLVCILSSPAVAFASKAVR